MYNKLIRKFSGKPFTNGKYEIEVKGKEYLNPYTGRPSYRVPGKEENENVYVEISQVFEVNNDDTLTEMEQSYIDRPIEEEQLSFKQFSKVWLARRARKDKRRAFSFYNQRIMNGPNDEKIKEGDKVKVRFQLNDKIEEVGGIVRKIYEQKDGSRKYDVSSGSINFKGIVDRTTFKPMKQITYTDWLGEERIAWDYGSYGGVTKRTTEDLSHIEIPDTLKKIATHRLLTTYNLARRGNLMDFVYINGKQYDPLVVKAELNNREDIPNKNIRKEKIKRQNK